MGAEHEREPYDYDEGSRAGGLRDFPIHTNRAVHVGKPWAVNCGHAERVRSSARRPADSRICRNVMPFGSIRFARPRLCFGPTLVHTTVNADEAVRQRQSYAYRG